MPMVNNVRQILWTSQICQMFINSIWTKAMSGIFGHYFQIIEKLLINICFPIPQRGCL